MNENRKPHAIVLRAAAVLLILVLFTTSIVSGRYARYTSSATGHDSARVAKFQVTEEGISSDMLTLRVRPGYAAEHPITVHNKSEVAIEYAVHVVDSYGHLPLSLSIKDGASTGTTAILAPGDTKEVKLLVYWDESETSDRYIGMVDLIRLTLTATQVD